MRVEVLNGVNLDVIGRRDPGVYGGISLNELESQIYDWGKELGVGQTDCAFRSDHRAKVAIRCAAFVFFAHGTPVCKSNTSKFIVPRDGDREKWIKWQI